MRQTLLILIIIGIGSSISVAYGFSSILDTTSIFQNIVVTGTCTGCGGGGEASYSNYNIVALNTTVANTGNAGFTLIGNDGGVQVATNSKDFYIALNGTTLFLEAGSGTNSIRSDIGQSETGKYKIMDNETSTGEVDVYKDGMFLQKLGIDLTNFFVGSFGTDTSIAISPDGKYITVVGPDSGGATNRVLIFQGVP